jgi:hypothetical protein
VDNLISPEPLCQEKAGSPPSAPVLSPTEPALSLVADAPAAAGRPQGGSRLAPLLLRRKVAVLGLTQV